MKVRFVLGLALPVVLAACTPGESPPTAQATPGRCSWVAISASETAPVPPGQSVTFTGTAYGCTPADYRFILLDVDTGDWLVTQGWSASSAWHWDTSNALPGRYSIVADARQRFESGDGPDVSTSMALELSSPTPTPSASPAPSP